MSWTVTTLQPIPLVNDVTYCANSTRAYHDVTNVSYVSSIMYVYYRYIKVGYNESRKQISAAKDVVKECARKLRSLEAELEGRYSDNVRKLGEYKSSIKAYVRQNTRIVDLANRLVTEGTDTELLTKGRDISTVDSFKDTLALQVPTLAENPGKLASAVKPLLESLQLNYHTETLG